MADANLYHLAAVDVRTELSDQLVKLGAIRELAMAAVRLADETTSQLEAMVARVNVELN